VGKPLNALRTPAFVVDRAVFAKNCRKMLENARDWGATFRGHLKTHKVGTLVKITKKYSLMTFIRQSREQDCS
jgi:D-serine deaminase-like pyridoxal phosphate-dependent protein